LNGQLPKTIWFLWLQGQSEMPLVARKCYESWVKNNPEWEVVFLDKGNVANYITLKNNNLTKQAFSDVLRINLLAQYGGVWVDATCFCIKPLDEWLYGYLTTGFFAFERPGPDRKISSWFIASFKGNYIILTYCEAVNNYWDTNPNLTFYETSKWYAFNNYLKRLKPQAWFNFFATKILKVYPYFWFHYLFEKIYLNDKKVREIWDLSPKISADIPHKLQFLNLFSTINDQIRTEIDQKTAPLYKLTWKFGPSDYHEETIMAYVLGKD
jgi:hypothetical protein